MLKKSQGKESLIIKVLKEARQTPDLQEPLLQGRKEVWQSGSHPPRHSSAWVIWLRVPSLAHPMAQRI